MALEREPKTQITCRLPTRMVAALQAEANRLGQTLGVVMWRRLQRTYDDDERRNGGVKK